MTNGLSEEAVGERLAGCCVGGVNASIVEADHLAGMPWLDGSVKSSRKVSGCIMNRRVIIDTLCGETRMATLGIADRG